ncbi:MAG: hypothetical protein ACRD82_19390, partial [Blastocatellia bacterium]
MAMMLVGVVIIVVVALVVADRRYLSDKQNLAQSRRLLYVANQLLAWKAFDEKDLPRANDFLEASFPATGASQEENTR